MSTDSSVLFTVITTGMRTYSQNLFGFCFCSIQILNLPRFHFKGDVPSFGDVLMILRPMFGGVILTLFKNIIKDKNM